MLPRKALQLRQVFSTPTLSVQQHTATASFSTLNSHLQAGEQPKANQPDSINKHVRSDTPNTDPQSTASQDEHKSGDDHPAKQPDPQAAPTRTTGFGGKGEVKGGKEGREAENERRQRSG